MNGVNQAYPQDHTMMLLVKSVNHIQTLQQDSKTQDKELEKAMESIIRKIEQLEKIKTTTQKNQSDLKAKLNTMKRDLFSAEMQSAQWQSQKLEDINHEYENYMDILDQLDQLKERNTRSEGLNPHDIQLKARILKTVNHMQKEDFKELGKTAKLMIAENRITVINVPNYLDL
jgi:ribosomal protein L29